jgi:hypothetical protein
LLFWVLWLAGFRWLDFELSEIDPRRAPAQAGEQRVRTDTLVRLCGSLQVGPDALQNHLAVAGTSL